MVLDPVSISASAELYASSLRSLKRCHCAFCDQLSLVLGDGGHDLDGERVGMGEIDGHEIHPLLLKAGDEGNRSGQSI
jgi:hypothetical protein